MKPTKTAQELLDMFYLDMRSALVETAAAFDRVERAPGGDQAMQDVRIARLRVAAQLILEDQPDRARRFLESLSVGDEA